MEPSQPADRGAILVLTLILTVILSIVVLAIASYVTTGLRTSRVTTSRNASNSVTASGLTWYIEELAAKRIAPDNDTWCSGAGVSRFVPTGLLAEDGATVEVVCTTGAAIESHPAVRLTAVGTTVNGASRTIEAVIQVPRTEYVAQVRSWTAD